MKINNGKMVDFVMNDKCAAGTGRFLEIIAATLGVKVEQLGDISLESTKKLEISSFCTIFAQQEVVTRLSDGENLEDIIAGLHDALASRVAGLARRLKIEPDAVLTGGVAKNAGIVKAMKENLGCELLIPEDPLLTGALGAAILANEYFLKAMSEGEPSPTKARRLEKAMFFR
jgi:predicted CoA-substrate-specific enzyme activase